MNGPTLSRFVSSHIYLSLSCILTLLPPHPKSSRILTDDSGGQWINRSSGGKKMTPMTHFVSDYVPMRIECETATSSIGFQSQKWHRHHRSMSRQLIASLTSAHISSFFEADKILSNGSQFRVDSSLFWPTCVDSLSTDQSRKKRDILTVLIAVYIPLFGMEICHFRRSSTYNAVS